MTWVKRSAGNITSFLRSCSEKGNEMTFLRSRYERTMTYHGIRDYWVRFLQTFTAKKPWLVHNFGGSFGKRTQKLWMNEGTHERMPVLFLVSLISNWGNQSSAHLMYSVETHSPLICLSFSFFLSSSSLCLSSFSLASRSFFASICLA